MFTHIYKACGVVLLCWLCFSCKKLIEIPSNPPTAIEESRQFTDSITTMSAVAGVYTYAAWQSGFTFNDGMIAQTTTLSSDELIYPSTSYSDTRAFYDYAVLSQNALLPLLWNRPYEGVYPVNVIIERVKDNQKLSPTFRKQVVSEMKVVRALYYFNLVNLFGAVPIVTSSDYKTNALLARSSVDSVYQLIQGDLGDAVDGLTAEYPSEMHYRPNVYVAKALRSKVELYRQQWQQAYDDADAVIASSVYALEPDMNNTFLDGSSEAIWQIPGESQYKTVSEAQVFVPSTPGTTPTYIFSEHLLSAFEPGDQRLEKWAGKVTVNTGSGDQDLYYPYKYKKPQAQMGGPMEDYMILRLGEVYLIRAEAAAHLNQPAVALADINEVRARAGLGESPAVTTDEVLAAVQKERQVELFTEWGNRWYDLKRTGQAEAVLGAEKAGWKPFCALYPVPRGQLQFNPSLRQNPGYN